MRNLKIYQLERSEYIIKLANEISRKSRWKYIKEEHDITREEWNALAGYWSSNDYKDNKKERKIQKKASSKIKREKVQQLKKLPYEKYLKSTHWENIKKEIKRVFKTCVICNSKNNLHVHHRSYKHRGDANKEIRDLILLCANCHKLFHENGKLK